MGQQKFLLVGQITRPHGIRGEVKVRNLTERPDLRFYPESELLAGPDESELRKLVINSVRSFKQDFLVSFNGFPDRNSVEPLCGWQLFVPRDMAAPPGEGRYYHDELIGLAVKNEKGMMLGTVCAVIEMPAQKLLEVERPGGKKFLVPLVDELVPGVDVGEGSLTVCLPDGLMDI